ncbi:MAG: S8 family serine peptidase [Candidatus Thalassarchaeaceae archaeon]|nr:S8 family serine peptidase [Candidatus Thalassarchaeaceae archaeon]
MPAMDRLELMPEPDDPRLLTTVDPHAPGYPGSAYGLSDDEARRLRWPLVPLKEVLWPWGAVIFSIGTVALLLAWPFVNSYLTPILPDSEWAYESSGIRGLQDEGLTGEGISVCIVDTGLDIQHPDLSGINLVGFRDFIEENHQDVRDVGSEYHGTMMTGILASNGTFLGAAPEASISVALALGPEGSSGQQDRVSLAIRWCRITQDADIISLSLGSDPGQGMGMETETVSAVQEAIDAGIFVVAAAGNTGSESSDVSVPANIRGVIAVGAYRSSGTIWADSASGSDIDPYNGESRDYPHQKPEITAPGVNIFSTASTSLNPPYAYSSGTSDSTVFVTGALALILEKFGSEIAGEDGDIDFEDIEVVKRALANSASRDQSLSESHSTTAGYGSLNAVEWANQLSIELNSGV